MLSSADFPGEVPTKIGNYLGDRFGALMSALGALAALGWHDRSGDGIV